MGKHTEMTPRVYACVSACAGIPTEALEADVVRRMREAAKHLLDDVARHEDGDDRSMTLDVTAGRLDAILKETDQ